MNPFRWIRDHQPDPKNSSFGVFAVVMYYVAIAAPVAGVVGLVCKLIR